MTELEKRLNVPRNSGLPRRASPGLPRAELSALRQREIDRTVGLVAQLAQRRQAVRHPLPAFTVPLFRLGMESRRFCPAAGRTARLQWCRSPEFAGASLAARARKVSRPCARSFREVDMSWVSDNQEQRIGFIDRGAGGSLRKRTLGEKPMPVCPPAEHERLISQRAGGTASAQPLPRRGRGDGVHPRSFPGGGVRATACARRSCSTSASGTSC